MFTKKFFKTKDEVEVTFEFNNVEEVQQVSLVGEFNGWDPIDMKKARKGPFKTKVRLPKESQYQFRYLVDGESWENDEAADAYWLNEHGTENSVISTFSEN